MDFKEYFKQRYDSMKAHIESKHPFFLRSAFIIYRLPNGEYKELFRRKDMGETIIDDFLPEMEKYLEIGESVDYICQSIHSQADDFRVRRFTKYSSEETLKIVELNLIVKIQLLFGRQSPSNERLILPLKD